MGALGDKTECMYVCVSRNIVASERERVTPVVEGEGREKDWHWGRESERVKIKLIEKEKGLSRWVLLSFKRF